MVAKLENQFMPGLARYHLTQAGIVFPFRRWVKIQGAAVLPSLIAEQRLLTIVGEAATRLLSSPGQ